MSDRPLDLDAIERVYRMTGNEDSHPMRLVAEVRRLRSLPVIETCETCAHCSPQVPAICCHPRRRGTHLNNDGGQPPPPWCPLRKEPTP